MNKTRTFNVSKEVHTPRDRFINQYLLEISKYNLLTAEDEVELAKRIEAGDEDALRELVNANLRFVVSVAKQYLNQGLSLMDLINEGNLGLIKAAKTFDHTRGFKFISYAINWIRSSISNAMSEDSRTVRIPSNKLNSANKIRSIKERFFSVFGRDPTIGEIHEELLKIDPHAEAYINLNNEYPYLFDIYDSFYPLDNTIEEDTSTPLGESLELVQKVGDLNKPDSGLEKEGFKIEISRVLAQIPKKFNDRYKNKNNKEDGGADDIIKMYYGLEPYDREYTLTEIGEMYDLSREGARQVIKSTVEKLRKILKEKKYKF